MAVADPVVELVVVEEVVESRDQRIDQALDAYMRVKSSANLDALLTECMPYIRAVVRSVPNPVRQVLDYEDLVQHGVIGFLGALDRYERMWGTSAPPDIDKPPVRAPFKNYARNRIHGSAMDAIRKASSTSRTRNVGFQTLDEIVENEFVGEMSEYIAGALPSRVTDALRIGMSRLPARQAAVLLLLMNGLTVNRVAQMFCLPSSRINQERAEGLESLREVLTVTSIG